MKPKTTEKRIAAIILAAGRSQRMGTANKLLLPIAELSILQTTVASVVSAKIAQVIVVLGFDADKVRLHLLDDRLTFTVNQDYQSGISSSLRCGLDALEADIDGAMIVLADMPFITTAQLDQLLEVCHFSPLLDIADPYIVVPYRKGKRGNPIIWHSDYFSELKQQKGDQGAKAMLQKYAQHIMPIEIDSDAIFIDIDTPADLKLCE